MPSPTKARRRRGFNLPPPHLKPVLEVPEEVLTFADCVFRFPLPPASTPALSYPKKRVQPLVITKLPRADALRLPVLDRREQEQEESDSEWYSRELSQILDAAPSPACFPAARKDSISIAPHGDVCHPFANPSCCRPLPRTSIPDDVGEPPWMESEPSPDRGLLSLAVSSMPRTVDEFLGGEAVSPVFDMDSLCRDDGLRFAFVFEDAGDEKSIQLVAPKPAFGTLSSPSPSPPPSSPPPSSSSSSSSPSPPSTPLFPTSAPPRPERCSTMTSISSLFSLPSSPIADDDRKYGLKSRWSSSTLGEEHEHEVSTILNASKKLKTYFRRSPSSSPTTTTKMSIPLPMRWKDKKKKKNLPSPRPQDSFLPNVEEEPGLCRSYRGRVDGGSSGGRALRRKPIPEQMFIK